MNEIKVGMNHKTTANYGSVATLAKIIKVYSNTWGDFVDMVFEDGSTISMYPIEDVNIVD